MKYYLIVGEASGDLHASCLMMEIKKNDKDADFRFFGGDLMQSQGGVLVKHYREMAFMGFVSVIKNLPAILSNMELCKKDILSYSPDVLILVDYPSFNLKIAKAVKHSLNIPVYYYISPKIWAWKEYRIKSIKKYIDKMFCILPFEVDFYSKHNYHVDYIGNPSVDELLYKFKNYQLQSQFRAEHELSQKPIVAILAGSRKQEVISNLHYMLKVAKSFPQLQPVVAAAPGLSLDFYKSVIGDENVKLVFDKTHELLINSQAALVTSGTATLEAAILNIPQVVCYKVGGGKLTYAIMSRVLKVKYVSLVNLIVNKKVVTELLAHQLTVDNLTEELKNILPGGKNRESVLEGYSQMKSLLGTPGAPAKAAKIIADSLV
ncbi:MAG: lipid-A-disaccharide synthase [Bacteroidales bacterium]|nr:lipid-A-disaccharide synthase [Bacteroidales bacterium]